MKASAFRFHPLIYFLVYYLVNYFPAIDAAATPPSNDITSLFSSTKPPPPSDENGLPQLQISAAQQQLITDLFGADGVHLMNWKKDTKTIKNNNDAETTTATNVDQPLQGQGGERDTDFDWRLVKEVFRSEKSNVIISPFSIKLLLVLLYEGTGGDNSRTAQELQQVFKGTIPNVVEERKMFKNFLDAQLKENKEYELDIGTNIFIDHSHQVQPHYKSVIQEAYNAGIEGVKFSDTTVTANIINSWCSNATRGHITDLVKEDKIRNAVMLMTNAIYFKGMWATSFPESASESDTFYVSSEKQVSVHFMTQTEYFWYGESTELKSKLLRLPYKGSNFSMTLVLPDIESDVGLLMNEIGQDPSVLANAQTQMTSKEGVVTMPRFKFDFSINLNEAIKALGIEEIFTFLASFPLLSKGNEELKVSNIIQKAGIVVNEEGAEAYAASSVGIDLRLSADEKFIFKADRPFLFFIEDQVSGVLLFAGKVQNPLL